MAVMHLARNDGAMNPEPIRAEEGPPGSLTYEEYRDTKHFAALDGLRAVSILLVLAFHANSAQWTALNGWLGVTIFFVISGYLITTLCLREEERRGRVSLAAFYIRRACRILPLYYVVLLAYVVVAIGLNVHHQRERLVDAMPYYASYLNDFTPFAPAGTPFQQSWSLGVEEKFYLVWPAVAFALLAFQVRSRFVVAASLALLALLVRPLGAGWYVPYADIMVGCLLAVALHQRSVFERLRTLARPLWAAGALTALVAAHVLAKRLPVEDSLVYPLLVAFCMVPIVAGETPWTRLLRTRPMVFIGERAYGIYLVHLLCLSVVVAVARRVFPGVSVDAVGGASGATASTSIVIFALETLAALVVADILRRTVELPFIRLGRRWSASVLARRETVAASDANVPAAPVPTLSG